MASEQARPTFRENIAMPAAQSVLEPFEPGPALGRHRLAAQDSSQIAGEIGGAGVALGRLLGQRHEADRFEIARDGRIEQARQGGLSSTTCAGKACAGPSNGSRPVSNS